jgi:glycosyltransferase involved in cell wall biosynthesis
MTDLSKFVEELNMMMDTPQNTIVMPQAPSAVPSAVPSAAPSVAPLAAPSAATKEKSIKILMVTTHTNQVNGYSKVVYNIIKQLSTQPWIKIVHFGTQKMVNADLGRIVPTAVKVLDGTSMDKDKQGVGFALAELPSVIQSEKPDVVWIYNDLTVICAYIEHIRKAIEKRFFKIWAYVDMTYTAPPQGMIDALNRDVERVFCFTKGWKDVLKSHGITRPVDVMNHGVDPAMFRPIPRDLARQSLGLPKDVFLFTSVNKNIPRKRLDLLIMSFVKLIVRFPTKPIFMLIVADKGDQGGFPLFEVFAREIKLNGGAVDMYGNRLLITSKDTCYRDEDINMLYNCGDAGISCAEGEGFGLCTFEQMSLGIPQIVPDINGYSEYCTKDNSLMIKPSMRYYIPQAHNSVTGEAQMVDPEAVSKAMEKYMFDENLRKLHGKLGKETVGKYTWEACVAILLKRLRTVQEEEE